MTLRRPSTDLRRTLARLAAEQAGYFTAAQALDTGYSYPAQRYQVARGEWSRVDRAIFRLPEWPASQHEDLVRWSLWSRDRAIVSHETALAVHELGDVMPSRVHVTVPPGFRARAPGVVLHVGEIDGQDVERREGYRVTLPARSIVDAAAALEVDQLSRVIGDALERGMVSAASLRARARTDQAVSRAIDRAIEMVAP